MLAVTGIADDKKKTESVIIKQLVSIKKQVLFEPKP